MNKKNDLIDSNSLTPSTSANITANKVEIELMHFSNYIANLDSDKKKKAIEVWNKHKDYVNQKILEYSSVGLSIANKDYHFISYAGIPDMPIDYKGMLKVVAIEARKNGYQLMAKADTIRNGAKGEKHTTNGLIDDYYINNGGTNEEIQSAYAILSLFDSVTRQLVMQKVEVLPTAEFQNAQNASKMKGQGANKNFPTEMAKKIAFRRCSKVINTFFASDVLDKLFNLDNDAYSFKNESSFSAPKTLEQLTGHKDNQ